MISYNSERFSSEFLTKKGFIVLDRSIRVSFICLCKGSIAIVPFNRFISIQILLHNSNVQESINSNVIQASIVSGLMQALLIQISYVCSSDPEIRLDLLLYSFAFGQSQCTMSLIIFISSLIDKETVPQSLDSELTKVEMTVTLFSQCARVEQENSTDIHLYPCWRVWISVVVKYIKGQFRDCNSCISVACQVHPLVLQFREFFVESQQSSKIFDLTLNTDTVSYSCVAFDIQNVGLFVPVVLIMPEVYSVSGECKFAFGVEPTVKRRATWSRRHHYNQWIF